jgi:WD40 repeat protein
MRIAIAPDGHTIATGTADGEVRFASARTGRPLGPPTRADIGAVLALAFSPAGAWLATSGEDHAIYVRANAGRPSPGHDLHGRHDPTPV